MPLLGADGVDLLKQMWEYVPEKRISAIEALKHPFFNDLKTVPGFTFPAVLGFLSFS